MGGLLPAVPVVDAVGFQPQLDYPNVPPFNILNDPNIGLGHIVSFVFQLAVGLGGLLAFAALLIAGFVFATSAGNPGKQKEAKDRILAAFIGVIILLGSFILLRVINPQILSLENRITNVCDAGSCTLTPIEMPVDTPSSSPTSSP